MTLVAIALAISVRVRLADVPLERDEGEYAYAGRLILQGIPPYSLAYNMKFPGTYYAYALIMGLLGQSPRGIHLGLALVNAATTWLVFAIGRRLLGSFPAAVAAVSFALLSLDRWVMGVFAHATHFVLLPALAGFLLIVPGRPTLRSGGGAWSRLLPFLGSGVLLGVAVLMKQHAILFLALGAVLTFWSAWSTGSSREAGPRRGLPTGPDDQDASSKGESAAGARDVELSSRQCRRIDRAIVIRTSILRTAALAVGAAVPLGIIGVVFLGQGVLGKLWFWTFQYAREYVSEVPMSRALPQLSMGFKEVTRANLPLWLIAGAGVPALWLTRWDAKTRTFLTGLLLASFLALCPGFYFREHYFILLLPVLALFIGVFFAAAQALIERIALGGRIAGTLQWRPSRGGRASNGGKVSNGGRTPIRRGALVAAAVLFATLLIILVLSQRNYLFSMSPRLLSRTRYGSNPFIESVEIAKYIRERTDPRDRIAVLGSEPEIYFYADRLSATGYIYVYALMEPQLYASRMQEEMIGEIESAHPKYLVFAQIGSSWLARPGSDRKILEWGSRYMEKCYDLVGIADIVARDETRYVWDDDVKTYTPTSKNLVFTFQRKSDDPCVAPH